MALVLSDSDTLKQTIEAANPREIFMKVFLARRKDTRRNILSILKVDPKTVQPTYVFSENQYKRKEYSNNMFMFLDSQYKIMGFLKGTKWEEDWESAEDYEKTTSKMPSYRRIIKKRKPLFENAYHILMFTSKDIKDDLPIKNKVRKNQKGVSQIEVERTEVINSIKSKKNFRLRDFQLQKYKNVDIIKKTAKLLHVLADYLIEPKEEIRLALKDLRLRYYGGDDIKASNLIKYIGEKLENIESNLYQLSQQDLSDGYREKMLFEYCSSMRELVKFYQKIIGDIFIDD